jgi:hypothetical protein
MGDLVQFLVKTPVTPRVSFYSGGVLTDLDGPAGGTCTVTLTKPDGTAGPVSGAVTHVSTGIYSFVLDGGAPGVAPNPIVYDITWAGEIGGKVVEQDTQAEALGELLFTVPAMRAMKVANGTPFALNAVPFYEDVQIRDAHTAVLTEMTRILKLSPVPRFARETHDGGTIVKVRRHWPRDLLSVTVKGVSQSVGGYYLHPSGMLQPVTGFQPTAWIPSGLGSVVVEYVHGLAPADLGLGSHVAMVWAAQNLNPSGFSSASTISMPDGSTYTYEPSETGRGGFRRHTGIRELDRWLNRWAESMVA